MWQICDSYFRFKQLMVSVFLFVIFSAKPSLLRLLRIVCIITWLIAKIRLSHRISHQPLGLAFLVALFLCLICLIFWLLTLSSPVNIYWLLFLTKAYLNHRIYAEYFCSKNVCSGVKTTLQGFLFHQRIMFIYIGPICWSFLSWKYQLKSYMLDVYHWKRTYMIWLNIIRKISVK